MSIYNRELAPSPGGIQLMLGFVHRDLIFSIKPKFAERIMEGSKTVELRRRFGREAGIGSRAYIYATSPLREMVGFATVSDIRHLLVTEIWRLYGASAGIERSEFDTYFSGVREGYAIVLEDPVRLRRAATMKYLHDRFGFVAPQSYRYAGPEYHALIG